MSDGEEDRKVEEEAVELTASSTSGTAARQLRFNRSNVRQSSRRSMSINQQSGKLNKSMVVVGAALCCTAEGERSLSRLGVAVVDGRESGVGDDGGDRVPIQAPV